MTTSTKIGIASVSIGLAFTFAAAYSADTSGYEWVTVNTWMFLVGFMAIMFGCFKVDTGGSP